MDMAFHAFADDDGPPLARSAASAPLPRLRESVAAPSRHVSAYMPRRSPIAIALVVLAHVVALYALIHFDVIAINRVSPQRLGVTMVEIAPPPPPHEEARIAPTPKVEVRLVAPPPVVALQAPPPPVIVAPPPAPVIAPPAPAAAGAVVAAPSSPGPVIADILADVIDAPPPRFPAESRRLRESGTVRLRVVVSIEGRVAEVAVVRSSGFDRLDEAALAAVRKWRFRARVVGGSATEAVGFVPVTFNPPH